MSGESVNNVSTFIAQPSPIPSPWGAIGGQKELAVPDGVDTSAGFGRATWAKGFPSETAQPIKSGGVPPHYLDFQTVLYQITDHVFWEQVGARYKYDAAFDYPKGACVADGSGNVYQALAPNGPHAENGVKALSVSSCWARLAPVDGQTITLDGSGRAKVNPVNVGSAIVDSRTVIMSGGALAVNLANIGDGTTIVSSAISGSGKLVAKANGLADGATISATNANRLGVNLANIADGSTVVVKGTGSNARLSCAVTAPSLSAYMKTADANSAYVKKAGDTMSGRLTVTSNGIVVSNGGITLYGAPALTVNATNGLVVNSGRITGKAGITVSGGAAVNGDATFGNNLVVKGTFSAVSVVGYVATPVAGASSKEIVNAAWVNARIKERMGYKRAPITLVSGVWSGANFSAGNSRHFICSIGATDAGHSSYNSSNNRTTFYWPVVEGRYIIRECTPYKPVIVLHDSLKGGDCWLRIRKGYGTYSYNLGKVTIGGPTVSGKTSSYAAANATEKISCSAVSGLTGANCYGGGTVAGQWYELGIGDRLDGNAFIVMPTATTCVIDVWDDTRGGTKRRSDDDRLCFFN